MIGICTLTPLSLCNMSPDCAILFFKNSSLNLTYPGNILHNKTLTYMFVGHFIPCGPQPCRLLLIFHYWITFVFSE